MKKITEHLGEILIAVAAFIILCGAIGLVIKPFDDFMTNITLSAFGTTGTDEDGTGGNGSETETESVVAPACLAPNSTWYKGSTAKNTITKINIVDTYTPTGNETESWAADVDGNGSIMCYVNGTELTMAGNGAGKIMANDDSSYMFGQSSWFTSVSAINGLEKLDTSTVSNMTYMFYGCTAVTALDVSNFNTGNVTYMDYMFRNCSGLTSLDLSNFDTGNVTQMDYMFSECGSLTSLDLSNFDIGNVTRMDYMFNKCSGLTSLDLSNFDTGNVTHMNHMFKECSSLTSLNVSNFNTGSVTDMGSMFSGCKALPELNVSNFDTGNVTTLSNMFSTCSSLTSLDLSSFNTGKAEYMSGMFGNCSALTVIYVGEGWALARVALNMFTGCGVSSVTQVSA